MQISWFGQSFFQIIAVRGKEGEIKIIIDPFNEALGLKIPSLEGDVLLSTHDHSDHNNTKAVQGSPFLITGPGEYEIKDVFIQGIPAWHDNSQGGERGKVTIYTILAEEIKICHLGDLGQRELTDEQLEEIGEIDILMIPVGGIYTISAKEAAKVISQIEPKIVIPMHYQLPKMKVKLEVLDKFLKIMGIRTPETFKKFSIKKKNFPQEGMKIIVLRV